MQPRLFSCQVNEILDVPTIGGTVDEEINPTTYQYTAALSAEDVAAVTSSTGIQLPTMTVKAGLPAPPTTANTGLSINDFDIFRKRAAAAINDLQSKIDSILNKTMVDCDVCG